MINFLSITLTASIKPYNLPKNTLENPPQPIHLIIYISDNFIYALEEYMFSILVLLVLFSICNAFTCKFEIFNCEIRQFSRVKK